ncbi:CsgG/HfaB family protein [Nevskia sp.]|uniref:CsgG/HfaB family protein n=1 Tax=Nevskia sp. TaxID=1929292 RepID=UPI0025E2DFF9|nr:CsgG/HfaB family protein [Nevskia sp.]
MNLIPAVQAAALALAATLTLSGTLAGCASTAPAQADRSASHQALTKLPRKSPEQRVAVAIYEVTSNLQELPPRGATEQFKTALVKSGQFRVVERAQLDRGVVREKQMNAAGQTSGNSAQQQLRGAEYIFQAEITELNGGAGTSSNGINIGGFQLGGASNQDELGLDVSIVDAATGDVVDAINVRKTLGGSAISVGGLGALVNRVMAENGKSTSPYMPEVQHQSTRKDSFDAALREAIEESVRQLLLRFDSSVAQAGG